MSDADLLIDMQYKLDLRSKIDTWINSDLRMFVWYSFSDDFKSRLSKVASCRLASDLCSLKIKAIIDEVSDIAAYVLLSLSSDLKSDIIGNIHLSLLKSMRYEWILSSFFSSSPCSSLKSKNSILLTFPPYS